MSEKKWYDPKDDAQFQKPYIDVEERRKKEDVEYTYIHGGFEGTSLKFSFCFPLKENYQGRFYQYLSPFPGPDEEMASLNKSGVDDMVMFALKHGAYFVETNMASGQCFGNNADPTIVYRSSAASAEYSRETAKRLYQCGRPYGYVFGGSGGSYKTFACVENTTAFDGSVPYVPGCPAALPNVIFVRNHALRILRDKMDWIIDAVKPGCSHGLYDGLNEEETAALKEVTALGYPPEAWIQYKFMGDGSLLVLEPTIRKIDPAYYEDYWTKPGYLGTVENSTAVRDRLQLRTQITEIHLPTKAEIEAERAYRKKTEEEFDGRNGVDDAWQKMVSAAEGKPWFTIADDIPADKTYFGGIAITVESGEAKGAVMNLGYVEDGKFYPGNGFGYESANDILAKVRPGDEIYLDNSNYIAVQTYHRHQVPAAEFKVWDQFRKKDGTPLYPQRSVLLSLGFAASGCGSIQSGDFHGKMICLSSLADDSAFPWMADWYRQKVREGKGRKEEDSFRLWYMEHCCHGPQYYSIDETTVTSYGPALYQALLDISRWVEKGIAPAKTTAYKVENGQVYVEEKADRRCGIQPVVSLMANGESCAHVKAGKKVKFKAEIHVPPHGGCVTGADMTYTGSPAFGADCELRLLDGGRKAVVTGEYRYTEPGTYFAAIRIKSNEDGDSKDKFTQMQNIAMARVIVE